MATPVSAVMFVKYGVTFPYAIAGHEPGMNCIARPDATSSKVR